MALVAFEFARQKISMPSLCVNDLPNTERPRERLHKLGHQALSNVELIAILLRTGIKGMNAIDLARQLLIKHKTLNAMARCHPTEIAHSVKGIGITKAIELVAAFALAHRMASETQAQQKIETPKDVCLLLGVEMCTLRKESLRIILLDSRRHLIRVEEISIGSISESIAHPREIFRPALIYSAHSVILVHNHPSGDPTSSPADHKLTQRLNETAALLQVQLLDHIILGKKGDKNDLGYFSFKQNGKLS